MESYSNMYVRINWQYSVRTFSAGWLSFTRRGIQQSCMSINAHLKSFITKFVANLMVHWTLGSNIKVTFRLCHRKSRHTRVPAVVCRRDVMSPSKTCVYTLRNNVHMRTLVSFSEAYRYDLCYIWWHNSVICRWFFLVAAFLLPFPQCCDVGCDFIGAAWHLNHLGISAK